MRLVLLVFFVLFLAKDFTGFSLPISCSPYLCSFCDGYGYGKEAPKASASSGAALVVSSSHWQGCSTSW